MTLLFDPAGRLSEFVVGSRPQTGPPSSAGKSPAVPRGSASAADRQMDLLPIYEIQPITVE